MAPVAQDPAASLARLTEAPTDDEAAVSRLTPSRARRPRWAAPGAAGAVSALVARRGRPRRARGRRGARRARVHPPAERRGAEQAGRRCGRPRPACRRRTPWPRAAAGAGPTGGDGPPCVYLRLPVDGAPAWARGPLRASTRACTAASHRTRPTQDSAPRLRASWRAAARLARGLAAGGTRASRRAAARGGARGVARPGTSRARRDLARLAGVQVATPRRRRPRSRRVRRPTSSFARACPVSFGMISHPVNEDGGRPTRSRRLRRGRAASRGLAARLCPEPGWQVSYTQQRGSAFHLSPRNRPIV